MSSLEDLREGSVSQVLQLEKELEESNKTISTLKAQIKTMENTIQDLEIELKNRKAIKKKGYEGQYDDVIIKLYNSGLSTRKIAKQIKPRKSNVHEKFQKLATQVGIDSEFVNNYIADSKNGLMCTNQHKQDNQIWYMRKRH